MIKIEPCGYFIPDQDIEAVNILTGIIYEGPVPLIQKTDLQETFARGHLVFAKEERESGLPPKLIGMGTIVFFKKITGVVAYIEDVSVLNEYQGKGVGKEIVLALLEEAKRRGVKNINLTSNPTRGAANALYCRLGFKQRKTNVYRLEL